MIVAAVGVRATWTEQLSTQARRSLPRWSRSLLSAWGVAGPTRLRPGAPVVHSDNRVALRQIWQDRVRRSEPVSTNARVVQLHHSGRSARVGTLMNACCNFRDPETT